MHYWQSIDFKYLDTAEITLLNLEKVEIPAGTESFLSVAGDATDLHEYADKEYDIVFSNSVIEHVGNFEAQKRMAEEMHRVGKHYYLQTPNKWFFIEPHYRFLFFEYLPFRVKTFLVKKFKLGGLPKADNSQEAVEIVNSIRLLTRKELQQLFPDAKIKEEKFLFMTKSFCLFSN